MNNTALQLRQTDEMDQWQTIREQALVLVKTGFLPQSIKTPEQAMAIILTGRELGIGAMAALNTINVIQGKPTISPQLMLALINRTNQIENLDIRTGGDGAVCTIKRKGRAPYTATFGPKEARAMGLDAKDNYKKQPATMYKWRAIADAARVTFPDVILGMYTPEEMGVATVDGESGEVIEMPRDDNPVVILKPEAEPTKVPETIKEPADDGAPSVTATAFWTSVRKWKVPEEESSNYAQAAINKEITWAEALNTLREMYG
jgi:hypothetical protein